MGIDTDLFVVAGLVSVLLAVPSAIGAVAEARFPKVALIVFVLGAAFVGLGIYGAQGTYSLARVPHSFIEILARVLN